MWKRECITATSGALDLRSESHVYHETSCWPPSMSYVAPVGAAGDMHGERGDVSRSDDAPDGQDDAGAPGVGHDSSDG
jgi:hypothetical protein